MKKTLITFLMIAGLTHLSFAFGPTDLCKVDDMSQFSEAQLSNINAYLDGDAIADEAADKIFPYDADCNGTEKKLHPMYRLLNSFAGQKDLVKAKLLLKDLGGSTPDNASEGVYDKELQVKNKSLAKTLKGWGLEKAANFLLFQELTIMFYNRCDEVEYSKNWSYDKCAENESIGQFLTALKKVRSSVGLKEERSETYLHFLHYDQNFKTSK